MKIMRYLVPVLSVMFVLGGRAYADLYSLSGDWSDAVNPNGPWSYWVAGNLGASSFRGGEPSGFSPDQPIWTGGWYNWQGWSKNNQESFFDSKMGDVYGHTDPWSPMEIRWTSPSAGVIDVSGGVWAIRDIGRWNDWELVLDGVLVTSGSVGSGDDYSSVNLMPISVGPLSVEAGDILSFRAFPKDGIGDYIAVDLSVNLGVVAVPLPGAAFLGAVGLGIGGWRLRRVRDGRV